MADIMASLRARRAGVESRLERRGLLHTVSAARYQLRAAVGQAIGEYAHGDVLEAGAGRSPYRPQLEPVASSITTLDIDAERNPDILGDVQQMNEVEDASYDTVLSTQVLEHVRDPLATMAEFRRVLRSDGVLIVSAPHLSMIHEAPNDYFRFTAYGFNTLCESTGLDVIDIRPVGGPLSLFAHVVSSAWLSTVGSVPGLFWPAWFMNYGLMVRGLAVVDSVLSGRSLLPRDYVLIARRDS